MHQDSGCILDVFGEYMIEIMAWCERQRIHTCTYAGGTTSPPMPWISGRSYYTFTSYLIIHHARPKLAGGGWGDKQEEVDEKGRGNSLHIILFRSYFCFCIFYVFPARLGFFFVFELFYVRPATPSGQAIVAGFLPSPPQYIP